MQQCSEDRISELVVLMSYVHILNNNFIDIIKTYDEELRSDEASYMGGRQ